MSVNSKKSGAGKGRGNRSVPTLVPSPASAADSAAADLPAGSEPTIPSGTVATSSSITPMGHSDARSMTKSSPCLPSSGSPVPPSAVVVVPRAIRIAPGFVGLDATEETVVSLVALLAGLLRETTSGDAIFLAFAVAQKMALAQGVTEEEFDRVKEAVLEKWLQIATTDVRHKAFGTDYRP